METRKVIIQGIEGSFHHMAAKHYFQEESLEIVAASSFQELVDQFVSDLSIDSAVMAIENTIAGSIMSNYSLLREAPLQIKGEVLMRIRQHLMALPGTKISDISEVHSHPMALLQCETFLHSIKHSYLRVEREDTALCAREIAEQKISNHAAIASDLAAEIFHLEIIAPEIETNKKNFTRFYILERKESKPISDNPELSKVSVCFSLPHKVGSLSHVLQKLSNQDFNLTKIQSVPIIGKTWEYFFFADFIRGDSMQLDLDDFFKKEVENYKLLGVYPVGNYYEL